MIKYLEVITNDWENASIFSKFSKLYNSLRKCIEFGLENLYVDVVVNFLSQIIFVFLLFLAIVMFANEVGTKEK